MVAFVSGVQPERPWPRWSQKTSRARFRSAARCSSHSASRAVKPWENTTVTGAVSSPARPTPSTSTCSGTPSSVVTVRDPGGGGSDSGGRDRSGGSVDTPLIPRSRTRARNREGSGAAATSGGVLADEPPGGVHLAGDGGQHALGVDLGVVGRAVRPDVLLEPADRPPHDRHLG